MNRERNAGRLGRPAVAKALLSVGTMLVFATAAGAVDARVRAACTSDYLAYCSEHDPDGQGVRQCMRRHGSQLSQTCINALAAAGEIPGKAAAKRRVARR